MQVNIAKVNITDNHKSFENREFVVRWYNRVVMRIHPSLEQRLLSIVIWSSDDFKDFKEFSTPKGACSRVAQKAAKWTKSAPKVVRASFRI